MRLVHLCGAAAALVMALPALAGDEMERPEDEGGAPAVKEVDKADVEVLEKVAPHFPRDASAYKGDVTCSAMVTLGTTGRAEAVAVSGCPDIFARNAKDALMQWRFKPYDKDGERVSVRFEVPVAFELRTTAGDYTEQQLARALADHEPLDDAEGEHCTVKVTVFADGTTGKLKSSQAPRCMVLDSEWVKYPKKLYGSQGGPVKCVATFKATEGEAGDVEFGECPEDYQKYAEKMIGKWTWQTVADRDVKYEARIFFNAKAE